MHETSVQVQMRAQTAERAPGCAVLPSYGFCECGSARGTLARGACAVHEVLQMQNQARPYARAVARDRLRGAASALRNPGKGLEHAWDPYVCRTAAPRGRARGTLHRC